MTIITTEKIKFSGGEQKIINEFLTLISDLYYATEDEEIEEKCEKIMEAIEYLCREKGEN